MIAIPYGKTQLYLSSSDAAEVLEPASAQGAPGADEDEIVLRAMENPIGSGRLEQLAKGKDSAVIIISDHTRPVPSRRILPHMLRALRRGEPSIDITLLVATGCHRETTRQELEEKLGQEIVERERVVVHDCDSADMTDLGVLPSGARLVINRCAAETDLLLAEGFIEPHFFAGFSGGRKSVLPGVCARETVLGNHCAAFIDSPRARTGVLDGNPIHTDMVAAARMAKLQYVVNVTLDRDKKIREAYAGDAVEAHRVGCDRLLDSCRIAPTVPADIVVVSNSGAPLDQNIYQTVKGLSTAEAVVRDGGAVIMCAACADGIGGELFYNMMSGCSSAQALLEEILKVPPEKTRPDQWQCQVLARVLCKCHVYFVTDPALERAVTEMKMEYVPTLEEALRRAKDRIPGGRVAVIPDGVSAVVDRR